MAVTSSALLQFGSGLVAYMTRVPGLEYSEEEADLIGNSIEKAAGTLPGKKAKAIAQFMERWAPVGILAGVVWSTTKPKYDLARATFAERRRLAEERARAISHAAQGGAGVVAVPVYSASTSSGVAGEDGAASRGIGVEGGGGVSSDFGGLE